MSNFTSFWLSGPILSVKFKFLLIEINGFVGGFLVIVNPFWVGLTCADPRPSRELVWLCRLGKKRVPGL
jgi:hypothetical protein